MRAKLQKKFRTAKRFGRKFYMIIRNRTIKALKGLPSYTVLVVSLQIIVKLYDLSFSRVF